jgi:hypothetical protein
MDQHGGEKSPLFGAAEGDGLSRHEHLEGTENPELSRDQRVTDSASALQARQGPDRSNPDQQSGVLSLEVSGPGGVHDTHAATRNPRSRLASRDTVLR